MAQTQALISARILALVQTGTDAREAFDRVIGPGAYDALLEALSHANA